MIVVPRRPMARFSKDYELRDVIVVFSQGQWQSWADVVNWLKTKGPIFDSLAPGEIARMLADFTVLQDEGVGFVSDPGEAYELGQSHRQPTAVLQALQWMEATQSLLVPDMHQGSLRGGKAD